MAKKTTEENSYASGFAVGVAAGVIGYLVFGTEKGEHLRTNFKQKLDEAKARLYEQGLIESPDISLSELIVVLQTQAQVLIDGMPQKKGSAKPRKKSKKFKGV